MKHLKDEGYVVTLDALSDLRTQLREMGNDQHSAGAPSAFNVLSGIDSNLADKWQYLRRDHDALLKALSSVASFIPEKE